MALAPYSPILLGVNKEAVKAPKLCSIDFKKEILDTTEVNFCHLKNSNNQLKMVKKSKKEMIFNEKTLFLVKIDLKSLKLK